MIDAAHSEREFAQCLRDDGLRFPLKAVACVPLAPGRRPALTRSASWVYEAAASESHSESNEMAGSRELLG